MDFMTKLNKHIIEAEHRRDEEERNAFYGDAAYWAHRLDALYSLQRDVEGER